MSEKDPLFAGSTLGADSHEVRRIQQRPSRAQVELHLPTSIEAERGIIAAVVEADARRQQEPDVSDVIAQVGGAALAEDFSSDELRKIWELLCRRHQASQSNDFVSFHDAAKAEGLGTSFGSDLCAWIDNFREVMVGFPALAEYYAAQIHEAAERRRKIQDHSAILERLQRDHRPLAEWYGEVASAAAEVAAPLQRIIPIGEYVHQIMHGVERLVETGRAEISGLPSGLRDLDAHLGGFRDGDLIILGARPSVGKSALGTTVTLNIGQRVPLVYVSAEMPAAHVAQRLLSQVSGVELTRIWRGPLGPADHRKLVPAAAQLSKMPIYVIDNESNWAAVLSRCQQLVASGARCVILDYLGLFQVSNARLDSWERIGVISREAKLFAKRMNVPVLLLAQLNREVAKGPVRRPTMIDLRGSGDIEQDADVIILIHREGAGDPGSSNPKAELIIDKFRNGRTGVVIVRWHGETVRFEDWNG